MAPPRPSPALRRPALAVASAPTVLVLLGLLLLGLWLLASCGTARDTGADSLDAPTAPGPGNSPTEAAPGAAAGDGGFQEGPADLDRARALVATMDEASILGQVYMLSWPSPRPEGVIMDWIRQRGIGAIKIFGWNGTDVPQMVRTIGVMQELSVRRTPGIPLIVATDQEGGWVRHIRGNTTVTPGNMALGAANLPRDSYLTGMYIAQELRALGVNMNFAPTVDIYVNPEAHVIGPRAFGDDPWASAVLGRAFSDGQHSQGVMSTAKHYPGHGNADGDSHGVLPVIPDDMKTLEARDLVPFVELIKDQIPSILVGHLNFPKVSGDDRPASLSPFWIKEVLREKYHYQGIVMTDDLYMGGAADYGTTQGWSMGRVVLEALRVGNDMVMLSRTPELNDEIWTLVRDAYREDPAFAAQIRESVARIIHQKLRFLRGPNAVSLQPSVAALDRQVPAPDSEPFFTTQAYRGVSLLRQKRIPVRINPATVVLISQDPDFMRHGRREFPGAREYSFPYEPFYSSQGVHRQGAAAAAQDADLIVFCLSNPNSLEVLQALEPWADKVVVVSTLTPVYLREVPWVKDAVAVYGWGPQSFRAGFDALRGRFEPQGINPIPVLLGEEE